MKISIGKGFWICRYLALVAGVDLMVGVVPLSAQEVSSGMHAPAGSPAPNSEAVDAWLKINSESVRSNPPAEWRQNSPSEEAIKNWTKQEHSRLLTLADRARDFNLKFPKNTHAKDAKRMEWSALSMALRVFGDPVVERRIEAIETELLSDSSLSQNDRYALRSAQVGRKAQNRTEFEKGVRELLKEFPDEPQSYWRDPEKVDIGKLEICG